jgi:hypothetical protein
MKSIVVVGMMCFGFGLSASQAETSAMTSEPTDQIDCPDGTRSCGERCCGEKEACCTSSDGTKYCDSGRCP